MQKNGLITIHTDGGSRGNPGPAASAFVVETDHKKIYHSSQFLGRATNNIAEYTAVLLSLEWLGSYIKDNHPSQISYFLDSELVVKQINGLYKVRDKNIKKIYVQVLDKIKVLGIKVFFHHILRNKNADADSLVNKELDANT